MSLTYQLTLSRDAVKFIGKQEKEIQERIRRALLGLTIRPPVGDIRLLAITYKHLQRSVGAFFGSKSESILIK